MVKKNIYKNPYIYLIFIFIFMFILNSLTPFILDDYYFMFKYNSKERIHNLFDIFTFLGMYYLKWSGRVVANFFSILFANMPKFIFNIVNSIIYTANIYLIFKIFDLKNQKKYYYLLFIHIILFIIFPVFGQCFVWLSGSCNYSLTLFFELLFLYRIINVNSIKERYIFQILLGLLAGMGNENSSLAITAISFLLIFIDKKNLKFHLMSFFSALVGYSILIIAPGNYTRISSTGGINIIHTLVLMLKVIFPLIIGFSLILMTILKKNKKVFKVSILLIICFAISYFSMAASPEMPFRSFNLSFISLFIVFLIFLDNYCPRFILYINNIIIIFIFCFLSYITFKEYFIFSSSLKKKNSFLTTSAKNKSEVFVTNYTTTNCRVPISCGFYYFALKPDHFPNDVMSKYYDINIYSSRSK